MPLIQVSLRASDLKNKAGMFGTSDPMAVVHIVQGDDDKRLLGKTEIVKNSLSPKWIDTFLVEYDPSENTAITVSVYDKEETSDKLMGSALFEFSNVIAKGSYEDAGECEGVLDKRIRGGGTIHCRLREKYDAGKLHLMLRGVDLKNLETFSKSDPFYELCRKEGNKWVTVFSKLFHFQISCVWLSFTPDLNILLL